MGKIFISYAHKDYDKAVELYTYLRDGGFTPWLAKKDLLPGQEWKLEVRKAIRESDVFIACLSKTSVNEQGFVQAELKEALDVAEEMPEGVIYIIPVRFDECDVPSRLEKYHWVDYFEAGEKERLIQAIQLRVMPTQVLGVEQERFFDAGERVRIIRNELGVSTSQFVELLEFRSQREFEAMENREKEFPTSLLKKISDVSGVCLDWLKHADGSKYEIEYLSLARVEEDLEYCANLNAQKYFLTLNKKDLHVGLVAQIEKYRYQVIDFGMELNFWEWVEDYWAIPAFYRLLKTLSDTTNYFIGVILPSQIDKQLFDGDIHFLAASKSADNLGRNFPYDLLDIEEERAKYANYPRRYGGKWMNKVHQEFRESLQREEDKNNNVKESPLPPRTVIFQEPTQLPSYERIIVWMFPFSVVDTSLIGQPEEISRTTLYDITVIVTFELVSMWNLFHPLNSTTDQEEIKRNRENHEQLKKILFWYGKKDIEKKLREGLLQRKEKLSLTTTSQEVKDRLDPTRIPDVNGFKFEV